mmetsp:Transcript_1980/g.4886  ORF Transcript_1980/g.4886 Transcript_1980/m.4886 type:complete len:309 (+) Transcript_1980:248-1174(+)
MYSSHDQSINQSCSTNEMNSIQRCNPMEILPTSLVHARFTVLLGRGDQIGAQDHHLRFGEERQDVIGKIGLDFGHCIRDGLVDDSLEHLLGRCLDLFDFRLDGVLVGLLEGLLLFLDELEEVGVGWDAIWQHVVVGVDARHALGVGGGDVLLAALDQVIEFLGDDALLDGQDGVELLDALVELLQALLHGPRGLVLKGIDGVGKLVKQVPLARLEVVLEQMATIRDLVGDAFQVSGFGVELLEDLVDLGLLQVGALGHGGRRAVVGVRVDPVIKLLHVGRNQSAQLAALLALLHVDQDETHGCCCLLC